MSRLILLATLATAMLVQGPVFAAGESRLHRILESGVLKVGTTGDWNPMSMKDPATNQYQGFDIDLATELAKDMGVKVEFVPTDWKTLVNGVVADKYDMTTSASLNMQRAKVAGYTKSYFAVATVPMVLSSNLEQFKNWSDIDKEGVTVAVTLGTVFEAEAREYFPNATVKSVEAPARDFQEVLANRALVSITSNLEASQLIEQYPQLTVVPVSEPRKPKLLAMLVAQDDQVWLNYLNHWIDYKRAQSFFRSLAGKWLGLTHQ
jgi:cyclohexadienyl dehydratase